MIHSCAVLVDGGHRERTGLGCADDPGAEVVVEWVALLVAAMNYGQVLYVWSCDAVQNCAAVASAGAAADDRRSEEASDLARSEGLEPQTFLIRRSRQVVQARLLAAVTSSSVRTGLAVDLVEGLAEVGGDGVGCGEGVRPGLDLDGAVAAGGLDELAGRPAGLVLDPAADGQGGEDDGQVASIESRTRW